MTPHTPSTPTAGRILKRIAFPGLLALLAALALAAAAQPAIAGTYTVTGMCSWEPYNQAPGHLTVFPWGGDTACPAQTARNVQGHFNTPAGHGVGVQFTAPPGSAISQLWAASVVTAKDGWQAGIVTSRGIELFNCPFAGCSQPLTNGTWNLNDSAVYTRVRCGKTGGCYNGDLSGHLRLAGATVTIADGTPPSVSAGGDLASGGWKGGTRQLAVDANDNVGIQETRALVDGNTIVRSPRACNFAQKVPCPNGASTLTVPLGGVGEGKRILTVQAIDTAGNAGSQSREILVDNTAPVAPGDVAIEGGAGWRSQNTWAVRWTNPRQQLAPIAAVQSSLCPPEGDSADRDVAAKAMRRCVSGSRSKTDVSRIADLELPAAGESVLRLWLVDAAGNHNPDSAVRIAGLGYDPTPPEVEGFLEQDPNDPARVIVRASDTMAPIIGGSVELRRRHAKAWRPLPTEARPGGLSAFVDDESLRRGRYRLRATVVNAAGLQQGTARTTDGKAKTLKLPIRLASRLRAGRLVGKTCHGRGAKRRCRQKLRHRVPVALGRRITLRGRLVVRGKPIKHQPLEVWQRVSLASAGWERIADVQTNARGRFRYKTAEGPARALRFRYAGTPQIRGDNNKVRLQVEAATALRANRRRPINGEYVTFSGQLEGAWRPPAGVLVELQVYARGRWRTFAQPRADAATGAWSYQYRFETVTAGTRFRFRARIRRQAGYPLATGHSRTLKITVRGL